MYNMYILYGIKDDQKFYIMNTNPVVWASDIRQSKTYPKRYNAEYSILRDYDNYRAIASQLESESLESIYVSLIDSNYNELGRDKIL